MRPPVQGRLRRKGKHGWNTAGKGIVFGLVKRNGRVKAMPGLLHDRILIMQQISALTRVDAPYYSDEWQPMPR